MHSTRFPIKARALVVAIAATAALVGAGVAADSAGSAGHSLAGHSLKGVSALGHSLYGHSL